MKSLPQLKQLTRAEISEMKSQLKPPMISLKMETSTKETSIKTAAYPFRCFVCDCIVERGSTYCEVDRERLCLTCGLPARRLRPLVQKEKPLITNT